MAPPLIARNFLLSSFLLLLLGSGSVAVAAELTRGPYLQMGTPTSVILRWRTDEPTESIVLFGTEEDELHELVGDLEETTEHVIELAGLDPSTRYFYSVGSFFDTLAAGPDYFFVTHPLPGTRKPTRVWVIGDCGTFGIGAGNQPAVRNAYYQYAGGRRTDVWLALGDNAYPTGTDDQYQTSFFNIYPALLRQSVLWSTVGNHETYGPLPPGGQFPYFDMFSFPTNGEAGGVASGTEKYYSFDYANIHFVCLDSELSDRRANGAMLTWLKADLEANTSDWLIAFWHSPPYSKGSHNSDNLFDNFGNMTDMRANAVQVLESYGVDFVLAGHSHSYERSYLLDGHYGFSPTLLPMMLKDVGDGRAEGTGPYRKAGTGPAANQGAVYVVAGTSGSVGGRTGYHPVMFFDALQLGSVVIDIDGQRLDARFLRETGEIGDHFTILKGAAPEPLRVCGFAVGEGTATVRWKSIAGEGYFIERTSSLEDPEWIVASHRIVANGATTSWKSLLPEGEAQGFYRVVQLPPDPAAKRLRAAGKPHPRPRPIGQEQKRRALK